MSKRDAGMKRYANAGLPVQSFRRPARDVIHELPGLADALNLGDSPRCGSLPMMHHAMG